ncbi:molybdopterin molybdotransferase MoeA [Paeniglutamicibacter gangotriensis]|uniref:Molybdopterin molybdenumtransferase n=1 Tax=Paeniglutamicibacter gangotriensis Lz1y TaxID=1276920 RepID=M7N6I7_9MICC|nr:gephyrin-like molybdotransferase Glp [Paeniglutamicibacter gangotriensis]EMQ97374.1 molybdenum cofactor synthesis domain-containing protein [Paeniglutamicibacter gangotriensis Lz1y]
MTSPFRRSVAEHQDAIEALLGPGLRTLSSEPVALDDALGGTLASDLVAPRALPPWDNSQMDGYAVHSGDLGTGPLRVVAPIAAGQTAPALERGTAAPIMTGAPMPVGSNTVVPIEAAVPDAFPTEHQIAAGFKVKVPGSSAEGAYVRTLGSDIAEGAVVVKAGTRLGPTALGLLAGLGVETVEVLAAPRVLLLSTGDELVAPGAQLGPGQIHDANTTLLRECLRTAGCQVDTAGVLDDSPEHFSRSLASALAAGEQEYQLVLSSGGISQGAFDVVKEVLADHGIDFGSVAMQPGGPQGAGTLALPGTSPVPFVALPGNPVSAYVSFEMFLRPVLAAVLGLPTRIQTTATLTEYLDSLEGKVQIRRGTFANGGFTPLGGASSHLLAALAASDAFLLIDENTTTLPAGSDVQVLIIGDGS